MKTPLSCMFPRGLSTQSCLSSAIPSASEIPTQRRVFSFLLVSASHRHKGVGAARG